MSRSDGGLSAYKATRPLAKLARRRKAILTPPTQVETTLAEKAPGLLDVTAEQAITAVVHTPYWEEHYRADGEGLTPTMVLTHLPAHLDLPPYLNADTGQGSDGLAYYHRGQGLIVMRPGSSGLLGLHEAAHILQVGQDGHTAIWQQHFKSLVQEWLRIQGEKG